MGEMYTAYREINQVLGETDLPTIDADLAERVAKRLFRKFGGKKHGAPHQTRDAEFAEVRACWINKKPGKQPLKKGWRRLIHDVSHEIFTYRYPDRRPHDPLHARLENEIGYFVYDVILTDEKYTKPKTTEKKPIVQTRYESVCTRLANWEAKKKRAENAIKKLRKQKRYYEKKVQK